MKGLTLAKEYYNAFGPVILEAAETLDSGLSSRLSIGLAGEGSQCFGYDDELSRDHDFAPGFCIWMTYQDYKFFGEELQAAYDRLPHEFLEFTRQNILAPERLGVMSVSEFYGRLTEYPETEEDWLLIPEANLAAAVNGEIWLDGCREFHYIREHLQGFYPVGALRKKLAARAAVMSQAGQYNLLRMLERDDKVAAALSAARFTEAAISMVHLLNRKYTPFYKWAHRSLKELAESSPLAVPSDGSSPRAVLSGENISGTAALAALTARELEKLPEVCILQDGTDARKRAFEITEIICSAVAAELQRQGFSCSDSSFLQDHLADISQGEDFTYGYD